MSRKTSAVWLYFSEIAGKKVQCELCQKTYSYRYGSVSNLKKHFDYKHPTINLKAEERFSVNRANPEVSRAGGNSEVISY